MAIMSYNDKYPDMSAMYAVQFEYENKLKDKIKELETELERTRKALDKAKNGLRELKDIIACPPDISYETCVSMYADGILQEITELEQKDVK